MTLLQELPPDRLTPSRLWGAMDTETRGLAARCLYDAEWNDAASRAEADAAIASAMRFRRETVRRLPVEKRIAYLTRIARPDDSLATALLHALHLGARAAMLVDFLDALGIPHEEGAIDTERDFDRPDAAALAEAADALRDRYSAADVDLYLTALLSLDPDFWGGLVDVLRPAT
jgi:hypothetical protein